MAAYQAASASRGYFGSFVGIDANNASGDAFGRLRVASPTTLFESTMVYDTQPLLWETVLAGGGAVAHVAAQSSATLTVASNNDSVLRQSKVWPKYRAGKSHLVALTFNLDLGDDNTTKTVGLSDGTDGVELVGAGGVASLKLISSPLEDNVVAQSAWNIDKFDGIGPSTLTIDWTKAQIMVIDLQWLGVGRVRVGFDIDGVLYPAHEFLNANTFASTYMRTASLPVRYKIVQAGATGGVLTQICSTVVSEGGFEQDLGITRSAGNGITGIGVTTRRPVCSIRPKLTFNSIANRALIVPLGVDLIAATNPAFWELVYNGSLTGASWASVGANSLAEVDVASTAISGGEVIASGFAPDAPNAQKNLVFEFLKTRLPLTLNIAGDASTPLSVVCTSFTGTSTVNGLIDWVEYG